MSQQTSYTTDMGKPFPGVIADIRPREIDSKLWEGTATGSFGKFVTRGAADNQVLLPSAIGNEMLGVIVAHQGGKTLALGATSIVIEAEDSLNVMREGNIYVATEDACIPGDEVFVRYAGKKQVQTLVFDADLVTSNVVNGDVGTEAISPVTFATSNAATMTALAAAILAANTSILTAVSNGTDTITVTTIQDAADQDLANFVVTLGASQAGATETETVEAINTSEIGNCRTDADSTTAVEVDWEFEETGAADGTVKIRKK